MEKCAALPVLFFFFLSACSGGGEMSREELAALRTGPEEILAKTVSRPWQGEEFVPGRPGGTWHGVIQHDPKTFNILAAEQDSASRSIVDAMLTYFFDYDMVERAWKPHAASWELRVFEAEGRMDLIVTLRDDLYWTWYGQDRRVKVTSDDVIFWYNGIRGDPECGSSAYYQQFLLMPDGTEAHIDIEKLDDRRFVFHFPRIVAEPLLAVNQEIYPRMEYEAAKRRGGADAVRELFSVNTDPALIPSSGKYYLTEYVPAQRLVFRRNPHYWEKDAAGISIPYQEEETLRIIPEETTQFLLFKQGETEDYSARPEDLDELVNRENPPYTVYGAGGSLGAAFWTFNQNPKNGEKPQYRWFTRKEFRQAMSCLLNRDRIISQVYRGLAEPSLTVFPEPNPFYDPAIALEYTYDPARAEELLSSIGFTRDRRGVMRDGEGRAVEFALTIRSESTVNGDIASIISDELGKLGIKVNVRTLDFQKMVELIFRSFDWDSMLMGLSGSMIWPSQGSNTWPSSGNLHLWNPNQESPATEWEARIDWLYNEGSYTADPEKAGPYWEEFQRIILEECPMIDLVRPRSFRALSNRWDQRNVYYDNMSGFTATHIFLAP